MDARMTHLRYATHSARPGPWRGLVFELYRLLCRCWLRLFGWRVEGDWPGHRKAVLVAAPHTSNWDGLHMLATAGYYRIKLSWMGKAELTHGPFGGLVRRAGCVPIDRSGPQDMVEQMGRAFDQSDVLVLAIPPEGSRSKTAGWKSGFYQIARRAGVPIVLSVLDYGTKTVRLSGEVHPSGDYAADLALIMSHYDGASGKYPDKFRKD